MRDIRNMNVVDAEASGWNILKDLHCEVVGKAIYKEGDVEIMKSTKRFKVDGGWIYNTSTEYRRGDNISVAEALVFIPNNSSSNVA